MIAECIGLIGGHSGDSLTDELHNARYEVALVGGKAGEPGMNNADYVLIKDLSEHEAIINFFKSHKVKFIIIGTGHIKAIELTKTLEGAGFLVNIEYAKSILSKDKDKFKQELIRIGVKTPAYLIVQKQFDTIGIVGKIGIPCVVKSVTDAVQPQKINCIDKLNDAIASVRNTRTDVMVEQYIKGNDCTVAVANDGNNLISLGVTYYSKAKEYGLKGFDEAYSEKISREKEKEVCCIGEKIVALLGFVGLSRIDFIIDERDDSIYVLELNSIMITGYHGSAYPFFQDQGIDIAKVMIQNALHIYQNKVNKI